MEPTQLGLLIETFDGKRHQNGVEFWYASELAGALGYGDSNNGNFKDAVMRAKEACSSFKGSVIENFMEVSGKPGEIKLTRYACYLIAINGDPKKKEVAFAQAYFVSKTIEIEFLQQRMAELERMESRKKLVVTEKEFSGLIMNRGVDAIGLAVIRSAGDRALFGGKTTQNMKDRLGLKKHEPLADNLPNVTLKAKDLATAITMENTKIKNLRGTNPIATEHESNNRNVRGALVAGGMIPEHLPAAENIKKIEARHKKALAMLQKEQSNELKEMYGSEE